MNALQNIRNFYHVHASLSCSGQPSEEQFQIVANEKYDTVINLGLAGQKYSLPEEARTVGKLGMNYFHIPVLFEQPEISDLLSFFKIMETQKGKKILVHCAANYRASTFTALYLFLKNHLREEQIQDFIFDIWVPDGIWQAFLDEGVEYIKSASGFNR